jgi:hypothetical protein
LPSRDTCDCAQPGNVIASNIAMTAIRPAMPLPDLSFKFTTPPTSALQKFVYFCCLLSF